MRILRVARFAARFTDFEVAPETLALMRRMVDNGEVDALVAERVWQELARGLMEAKPSRMFETLRACGALQKLLPELVRLWGVPQRADFHPEVDTGVHVMMVIDMAARLKLTLPARFAALTHDLGKAETPADILPRHIGHELKSVHLIEPLCERLRVPTDCRDVARLVARFHDPTAGVVLVDGIDVRSVSQHSLRRQMALVQQDPFLFAGTIADNIRFGRPEASDAEVEAAARTANADEFIARMPESYATRVLESAANLSLGQRQLVILDGDDAHMQLVAAESLVGSTVALGMTRELGPIIAAIIAR